MTTTKETLKILQTELTEGIIDSDISSKEKEEIIEMINRQLSKAAKALMGRETQLSNYCDTLKEKKDKTYSQAEIDSWNGMGK